MRVDKTELRKAVLIICEENNFKLTVKESCKGGLIAGACAFVGGMLAGPIGLAIGGAVGSIWGAAQMKKECKNLVQVIQEMEPIQKEKLFNAIEKAVANITLNDIIEVGILLYCSNDIKRVIIEEIINFLLTELKLQIAQ